MSALDGALVALRRVTDQRSAVCLAEVDRYRAWFLERLVVAREQVAQPPGANGSAKRPRTKAATEHKAAPSAADTAMQAPPAPQPARARRGKAPEEAARAEEAPRLGLPAVEEPAVAPADAAAAAPPASMDTDAPACPEPVTVTVSASEDAVMVDDVQQPAAPADIPAVEVSADHVESATQAQLAVALAVPLPSSPPAPEAEPAPPVAAEPSAAAASGPSAVAPALKHKVLALAMAEQARKKEEQLQQERKLKKEQLERQREAARQAAMQALPKAAQVPVAGEAPAKAAASSQAARPAVDTAAKASAMPRLKQAMEARAAQRLELAAKDKAPVQQEEETKLPAQSEAHTMPMPSAAKSAAAAVVSPTVVAEAPVKATSPVPAPPSKPPVMAAPPSGAAAAPAAPPEIASYEISPYKSGSDSDEEERPRKPVPSWARTEAVLTALQTQVKADPDAIFMNPQRTCSLVDVFQYTHNKKRDFTRRGSSGNWAEDQLTWKEELSFKRRMGYTAADSVPAATPHSTGR